MTIMIALVNRKLLGLELIWDASIKKNENIKLKVKEKQMRDLLTILTLTLINIKQLKQVLKSGLKTQDEIKEHLLSYTAIYIWFAFVKKYIN